MARKESRASKFFIEKLKRQQAALKYRIGQSRIVAEGVNSPFWKAYKKMMLDKKENVEIELFSRPDLTESEMRVMINTVSNLKMFIEGPSDFEKSLEAMEKKLSKIESEIDERKSKL